MDNWDLQAVVGGSTNNIGVCISDVENPPFSSFDPWSFQQENDLMSFPQNFDANPKVLDELEELYKPFYPELNQVSTQTIINSSLPVPQDVDEAADNLKGRQSPVSETVVSGTNKETHTAAVNKPKRSSRKNQQNRVVQHVTVDDLSSDVWAWRKYGQKPIKGSPYPRSYYRCSSSKGCLARKQVERSCSDPRTLIITYTAEHSHSHPTRRSSLAGSTRSKPTSSSKSLAKNINESQQAAATILSPIKIKDECQQQELMSIKMEEQMVEEVYQGDGIDLPPTLSDELLQNLESFEGLSVDQFANLSHELWSMKESANFEQELAELVLDLAS